MKKRLCGLFCLAISMSFNSHAQTYPFTLPEKITATLSVNTKAKEVFNNKLISVNIDWNAAMKNNVGYNHPDAKAFIRAYKPVSIRFPQGVWSNFYDWEVDARRRYDDYDNKEFTADIERTKNNKFGFEGFTELHNELKFDVLWTYNVNYDSEDKTVRRLRDSEAKGFDVTHIELSNENFWGNQRSERVSTPEKFTAVAKSISAALKAEKPSVKVSIPLSWRRGQDVNPVNHDGYNKILAADSSYFDAITVHRYVHLDRFKDTVRQESYQGVLTARLMIAEDVNYCRSLAPGKPVWLSEWGVSCGYHAASYLGMADAYLYIFENQNIYEYTNWFHLNNYNAFFKYKGDSITNIVTCTKTGYGAVYDVLRSVFQDSELLKGEMTTHQLKTGSDAVVAMAATKNGATTVFAANKTPQSVVFNLKLDDKSYDDTFTHEAMTFDSLGQDKGYKFEENPLNLVKKGRGTITLPPYSVNKISIK